MAKRGAGTENKSGPFQPSLFDSQETREATEDVSDVLGPVDTGAGASGADAPPDQAADPSPIRQTVSRPLTVLIDGNALAYRSYFALKSLTTSKGVPTNAVYGFARTLLDLLRASGEGSQVAVAFDTPARTSRAEQYPDYKAQRAPMPTDLPQQLGIIKHLLDLLGVPRVEKPGTEADDVLATLATRSVANGRRVEIVTSDRDALQLVDDNVVVRSPDSRGVVGPDDVLNKYGVRPDQWVDYRALTGDQSDNIPGVAGIGPVAARNLLLQYGTVSNVLANLDSLQPSRYAQLLAEGLDALELSRSLSTLDRNVDLPNDLHLERRSAARNELAELLRQLEFGSVLRELGLTEAVEYESSAFSELQADLLGRTKGATQTSEPDWSYGYVLSSVRATEADITALAIAAGGRVGTASGFEASTLSGPVNAVDAKALAVAARRQGADVVPGHDPLLMAYLLDAASGPEALARRLGAGEWGESAESRAVVGAELLAILYPQLEGAQKRIYEQIEQPLQTVLADMELAGIQLDSKVLADLAQQVDARLTEVEERLKVIAEDPGFRVGSRDQVAKLLYEKLHLRAGKKTTTGKLSTAVSALEPLTGQHEAVDLILEHRELAKLSSTYLGPLADLADAEGRVHTTFQQTVVATGRLSSVNPNLQSIPVRSALGREIRRGFVAAPGSKLLVADYSQIELRVLAHMAEEPVLAQAFIDGADIHSATAATIYDVPLTEVDSDKRRVAKTINFGILYGMGPQRLSRELRVPYARAEAFISTYFARYPRIRAFIDETLARGREFGYVETLLGRRRTALELRSTDRAVREAAERMTFNMPVQGSAADIMKLAMLQLAPALNQLGGRLLLQVHDEIVAEVPEDRAAEAAHSVQRIMSDAYPLRVPLLAEVGLGPNWLEAK